MSVVRVRLGTWVKRNALIYMPFQELPGPYGWHHSSPVTSSQDFKKAGIYLYTPHKCDHDFVSTECPLTSNHSTTNATDLTSNRSAQSVSQSPPEGTSAAHRSTNEDLQSCCPGQQNSVPTFLRQKTGCHMDNNWINPWSVFIKPWPNHDSRRALHGVEVLVWP